MTEQIANPLLANIRLPGETFRLPSQGLFYSRGELDSSVKNGEVEVYPLTAIEEIILATPDKLLSGKAVLEVFTNCIPQVLNPGQLLAADVDYLMVCLRMVTFGPTMDISYNHHCSDKSKDHTYAVDLQQMIRTTRSVDPTKIESEYFVTLPNGQVVIMKPLTQDAIVELYQNTALGKTGEITQEEAESLVVDTLANAVRSVDGDEDKMRIREWMSKISLGWKRQLERATQQASRWGVDFTTTHTCKDCGAEIEVMVSPNPFNFFT